jgi:hypothetical protein
MTNKQVKFYEICSETVMDRKYILRKTATGWKCSCPAFVFYGKCKHIKKYVKNNKFINDKGYD